MEAFQTTDEYNIVLFSWYFKGFKLLRRYLVKHPAGVDMESLDLSLLLMPLSVKTPQLTPDFVT